jgi:DNA polymerase-3 subunit gamma/tau
VDHVLRLGGGSARDTLSALDQVAALGEVVDQVQPVDAVVDALCERDPGKVLVAVADALASGRDPRGLGESIIVALRDAFLAVMGAADEHLAPAERERAASVGERMGAAGLTRALDVLGEALIELARKPDPRIVVEVALVRITQPSADRTLDAILDRLDRLERATPAGGASGPAPGPAAAPAPAAPGTEPAPAPASAPAHAPAEAGGGSPGAAGAREALTSSRGGRGRRTPSTAGEPDAAPPTAVRTGKPTLGAVARSRSADAGNTGAGDADTASDPAPDPGGPAPAAAPPATPTPAEAPVSGDVPGLAAVDAAWSGEVLAALPIKIRSKWRGGRWIEPAGGSLRFAVPSSWHKPGCDESRRDVEAALSRHLGTPVSVAVVVDSDGGGGSPVPGPALDPAPDEEHIDPGELRDADDVAATGVDLLLREFGGELVEEEP